MENWKLILLFLSAFAGGAAVFLFKKNSQNQLKLILALSGSYLFAITVLHLIPEVYLGGGRLIGLCILGGFLLQIIMEQFSEGIEHGHIHLAHRHKAFPWSMMISLCIHAFLEGMPLIQGRHHELVFGIALHHIPAAFVLGTVLLQNKIDTRMILIFLFIFAMMCPLGYWASYHIGHYYIGPEGHYFDYMMGIVIGIFLHISTTILFESSVDHRFNIKKLIAVCAGIFIALIGFLLNA